MKSKIKEANASSEWPVNGLESVPTCPVCGANERELLHEGLTDKIFFCAPGAWRLYHCKSCASAYLDPRPSQETIELAYKTYFTHAVVSNFSELNFSGKIKNFVANSYRNYFYGTKTYPASSLLGAIISRFMSDGRASIDSGMRHLPKISTKKKKLLDFGCGNGSFLMRIRSANWDVVGADFDSKAVEMACNQGLDVRLGGVENFDLDSEQFDVITLSHVIEHIPDPLDLLRSCYKLLKPDGFLWIETPNIESEGHKLFGRNWRGLEPPRHLVIFNLKSMFHALESAGFLKLEIQPTRPVCYLTFIGSLAIKENINLFEKSASNYITDQKHILSAMVKKSERISKEAPEKREFITIKAWKI